MAAVRRLVLVVLAVLTSMPVSSAMAQDPKPPAPIGGGAGGGATQAVGGGGCDDENPCPPGAWIVNESFTSVTRSPESGPYTFNVLAQNVGFGEGIFELSCQVGTQVPCGTTQTDIHLNPGQQYTFNVTYSTKGLGSFPITVVVSAIGPGGQSSKTRFLGTIRVEGPGIANHMSPIPGSEWRPGDTLKAALSHPSGINASSFKVFINTTQYSPTTATSTLLTKSGLSLTAGTKTWKTYGCAVNGRCDTVTTTFESTGSPVPWELDDSLPPPNGAGIAGLLGGLPLPPESLRGCPIEPDDPEIRLSSPVSYLSQPGSASMPAGLVFAASVGNNASMVFSTLTVDHKPQPNPADEITCDDFTYLDRGDFDWWFWQGTDPESLWWNSYPYSDKSWALLDPYEEAWPYGSPFELAFADYAHGPNPGVSEVRSGFRLFQPAITKPSRKPERRPHAPGAATSRALTPATARPNATFIPDPGAINPSTYKLTLNGIYLINNGVKVYGPATLVSLERAGAIVTLPNTDPLLNSGWNEVIATISDSTNHTTSVRSRFVQLAPGGIQPLALTPMRDFRKHKTEDCSSFGAFQCEGVMLVQTVPGFVSRDKDRSLHLVYRSESQRLPKILPVEVFIGRQQKAPDSLWVTPKVGGVSGAKMRYAGLEGEPEEPGVVPIWEDADERRVVGVEVNAGTSAQAAIRPVTVEVKSFYGGTTRADSVSREVVELQLMDTLTTRFGPGWALAEWGRLHISGLTSQGAPAAIHARGDGSYLVFRKIGSTWVAPPGERGRMTDIYPNLEAWARYILDYPDGSRIGFTAAGYQVWTEDLVGNKTTFHYLGIRPNTITDPSGIKYKLQYNDPNAPGQVTDIVIEQSGQSPRLVAKLSYDPATKRLLRFKAMRSPTLGDSTVFAYHPTSTKGSFVTSITDPRSTPAKPVVSTLTYDSRLWTPVYIQRPPDRTGMGHFSYFRSYWRRAVPRVGWGRDTTPSQPLERLVFRNQLRGTGVDFAGGVIDYYLDPFGGPTWVRSPGETNIAIAGGGGFFVPPSMADDLREIARDSTGRVTKIVQGRNVLGELDSLVYQYDTYDRLVRVIRTTLQYPVGTNSLDTLTFAYDSVNLTTKTGRCVRLRASIDPMGSVDSVYYGAGTGPAACLPTKTVGIGKETTLFAYGLLTPADSSTTRPTQVTDPAGIVTTMTYNGGATWNTRTVSRPAYSGTAVTTAYYDPWGRVDSVIDPVGTRTMYLYDGLNRVTHQKTGTGLKAPVTASFFAPGGVLDSVRVYAAPDEDITVPDASPPVQTTRYFTDRLGQVDSTLTPGARSPTKIARKESWVRAPSGNPIWSYSGNGSYIARVYDHHGRVALQDQSMVAPSMSADGEPFADATSKAYYQSLQPSVGDHLSAGQYYRFAYDNEGRPHMDTGFDTFLQKNTYVRWRYYSAVGAIVWEAMKFEDKVEVDRRYRYNRRGQRTVATDSVKVIGGSLSGGEAYGRTEYFYDDVKGRLDSLVGFSGTDSSSATKRASIRWSYDAAGREILREVVLDPAVAGGKILRTQKEYNGAGLLKVLLTQSVGGTTWYHFHSPSYDKVNELLTHQATEHGAGPLSRTYQYSTDGTRRLTYSQRAISGGPSTTYAYGYDAFGNKAKETVVSTIFVEDPVCTSPDTMYFGADNRLLQRRRPACGTATRYFTDQAGNRIAQLDSLNYAETIKGETMSYTAANQLYYSLNYTAAVGQYDANWHWYDGNGLRIASHHQLVNTWFPDLIGTSGNRTFHFYDGSDVALTLVRSPGGTLWVRQRYWGVGVDGALAGRFATAPGGAQTLALATDRHGSTLAAVKYSGIKENQAIYYSRSPFGANEGASGTGGNVATGTGFTGASTPNQTGGFTYLRNRWYDGKTGRFLTQDPIGLAGGVNLYAYAGNNPVSFSDPFGLCKKPKGKGVGICIESFIRASMFGAGNGRGPRSNGGGYKTSHRLTLDPSSGGMSASNLDVGRTYGFKGYGDLGLSMKGSMEDGWDITATAKGVGTAFNTIGLGPGGEIDFSASLHVSPSGEVTFTGGDWDGFPSIEIWVYPEEGDPYLLLETGETSLQDLDGQPDHQLP